MYGTIQFAQGLQRLHRDYVRILISQQADEPLMQMDWYEFLFFKKAAIWFTNSWLFTTIKQIYRSICLDNQQRKMRLLPLYPDTTSVSVYQLTSARKRQLLFIGVSLISAPEHSHGAPLSYFRCYPTHTNYNFDPQLVVHLVCPIYSALLHRGTVSGQGQLCTCRWSSLICARVWFRC